MSYAAGITTDLLGEHRRRKNTAEHEEAVRTFTNVINNAKRNTESNNTAPFRKAVNEYFNEQPHI